MTRIEILDNIREYDDLDWDPVESLRPRPTHRPPMTKSKPKEERQKILRAKRIVAAPGGAMLANCARLAVEGLEGYAAEMLGKPSLSLTSPRRAKGIYNRFYKGEVAAHNAAVKSTAHKINEHDRTVPVTITGIGIFDMFRDPLEDDILIGVSIETDPVKRLRNQQRAFIRGIIPEQDYVRPSGITNNGLQHHISLAMAHTREAAEEVQSRLQEFSLVGVDLELNKIKLSEVDI